MLFELRKKTSLVSVLVLCGFLGACSDSGSSDDDDSEDTSQNPVIGAFNAVSDLNEITLLTYDDDDEYRWADLGFGQGVTSTVAKGEIGLRAEIILPSDDTTSCAGDVDEDGIKDDDECTEIANDSIDVVKDTDYMVVLYGEYGDMEVLHYNKPLHVFDTEDEDEDGDAEDENAEVWFFNLTEALGEVDVYIEAPGTNLSPVQVKGTLAPKGNFSDLVDEGQYVITLTKPADPETVLFTSETFTITAQTRLALAIRDGAGEGPSPVKITVFRGQSKTLLDRNASTELRFAHAVPDGVPDGEGIDVYLANELTTPAISALAFAASSEYTEIAPSLLTDLSVDVTPTGNTGLYLARQELDLTQGQKATYYFVGDEYDWDGVKLADDVRRLATHAQLRLINGKNSNLDYYVVDQHENISTLSPTDTLSYRRSTGWEVYNPGTYDLVVTDASTDTIVYSDTIELVAGNIYSLVTTINSADPTAADAIYLDDFVSSDHEVSEAE